MIDLLCHTHSSKNHYRRWCLLFFFQTQDGSVALHLIHCVLIQEFKFLLQTFTGVVLI